MMCGEVVSPWQLTTVEGHHSGQQWVHTARHPGCSCYVLCDLQGTDQHRWVGQSGRRGEWLVGVLVGVLAGVVVRWVWGQVGVVVRWVW